MPVPYIRL